MEGQARLLVPLLAVLAAAPLPLSAQSASTAGLRGRITLRGRRPGGPYRITVTHIGFRDFAREDIELLLGR
ncbi:MAG: hypothetical protein OXK74_00350, partial [Gemmatimonadota bacterium]|nr:hypothetical protein [Gemmatimonadota bacterium]